MSINFSGGKWLRQPVGVSKLEVTEKLSAMYIIANK